MMKESSRVNRVASHSGVIPGGGAVAGFLDLSRAFLDLLFPRVCPGCGCSSDMGGGGILCWDCIARLDPVTRPFCRLCGDPVSGDIEGEYLCSWCMGQKPAFNMARSVFRYTGLLRDIIRLFKYQDAVYLSGDLGCFMADGVKVHYGKVFFDALTYVPLHPEKRRERSFNQSALLASKVSRELCVPVYETLERVRYTASQTGLSARARSVNVSGCFNVLDAKWTDGRAFLLVDDVMTTGATVNECSRVLRLAGAASVHVMTLARGA